MLRVQDLFDVGCGGCEPWQAARPEAAGDGLGGRILREIIPASSATAIATTETATGTIAAAIHTSTPTAKAAAAATVSTTPTTSTLATALCYN